MFDFAQLHLKQQPISCFSRFRASIPRRASQFPGAALSVRR
jgi:hypothetical protein